MVSFNYFPSTFFLLISLSHQLLKIIILTSVTLTGKLIGTRAGHGSVRAGFDLFGHPTRAPRVGEFPTRDMKEKVETWRVFRWFGAGFFGRVGWADHVFLGYFHWNDQEQNFFFKKEKALTDRSPETK
jgi:hypothetical protein